MPDRIAHPVIHGRLRMFATESDNARVVIHLGKQHNIPFGLHDLRIVIVKNRQLRRPAGRAKANHTALTKRAHLGAIVRSALRHRCLIVLLSLCAVRQPTIGRIGNDRRADFPVDDRKPLTGVHPKGVVAAYAARVGRLAIWVAGQIARLEASLHRSLDTLRLIGG